MVITRELAQPIVDKLQSVVNSPINIMDHNGTVVASSEPERIGSYHEGALQSMRQGAPIRIDNQLAHRLKGTRCGITLPLQLHGSYVGAVGVSGNAGELEGLASVIEVAVTSLFEQAYLSNQTSTKQKILDNWVVNLTAERLESTDLLRKQARYLNLDLGKTCSIVVVYSKRVEWAELSITERLIQQTAMQYLRVHFFTYVGHGLYVLAVRVRGSADAQRLPDMCTAIQRRLGGETPQSCYIGVGKPRSELGGYRQSYFDALQSVRILERLGGEKSVIYYYEHQIFRLLEATPEHIKKAFASNYLDETPLDGELFHTLAIYFDMDRRINETSEALHIHRNTLIFRLNKVKDMYGLDPRSFRDAMTLQLLLYLLKFPGLAADDGSTAIPFPTGSEDIRRA